MLKQRYITNCVISDLSEKMVFITGPRQVGKTTLAKNIIGSKFKSTAYFNWDNQSHRREIINSRWPGDAELIILDEIHKYGPWKSFIKGEFDVHKEKYKFLITGSARLDIYRKGGDSLQGRYHLYRLHPFTLAEISERNNNIQPFSPVEMITGFEKENFEILEKFGGFPEPLFSQSEKTLRRWQNERNDRLFREDIRDVEVIRELGKMKVLSDMLIERASGLISINNIREDLEVSHRAVSSWLDILESFYYHFRIYPFAKTSFRSLKKEPKLYLWDWSQIEDEGKRFENMVALHLLKLVDWLYDWQGYRVSLNFLRDTAKREVDFLISVDKKPWMIIETKTSDENPSLSLRYFREKLKVPYSYQVLKKTGIDVIKDGIRVVSADRFLASLV